MCKYDNMHHMSSCVSSCLVDKVSIQSMSSTHFYICSTRAVNSTYNRCMWESISTDFPKALEFASAALRADPELVEVALKRSGGAALRWAEDTLKGQRCPETFPMGIALWTGWFTFAKRLDQCFGGTSCNKKTKCIQKSDRFRDCTFSLATRYVLMQPNPSSQGFRDMCDG